MKILLDLTDDVDGEVVTDTEGRITNIILVPRFSAKTEVVTVLLGRTMTEGRVARPIETFAFDVSGQTGKLTKRVRGQTVAPSIDAEEPTP